MKLDLKFIGYINLFEKITKTNVRYCFLDKNNYLVFIVNQNQGGKAIGKGASNVKKLANLLKKKIKIIEFNENVVSFIKNILYPLKPNDIKVQDKEIIIKADNSQLKALLIGRNKTNIKALEELVNKYFKDIKIKVG